MKKIFASLFLACNLAVVSAENISIIPQPVKMEQKDGVFRLSPRMVIGYEL